MIAVHVDPDASLRQPGSLSDCRNDDVATPPEPVHLPKAAERRTLAAVGVHAPEPALDAERHHPAVREFGGLGERKPSDTCRACSGSSAGTTQMFEMRVVTVETAA